MENTKKPLIGMRLDIIRSILDDIDSNPKLQAIFGAPASTKLGIVAEGNDIKIVEGGIVKLNDASKKIFLAELDGILKKRITNAKPI